MASTITPTRSLQTSGNGAQNGTETETARRGRGGQFRGRGRRGRGRGGSQPNQSSSQPQEDGNGTAGNTLSAGNGNGGNRSRIANRNKGKARENAPKPRLTHFLALPLGHHAELRERISAFTTSLLSTTPAIPGLDRSIVIPARRLHLTLGVMSLTASAETPAGNNDGASDATGNLARPQTLESAVTLLNELRPRLIALLNDSHLRVALNRVDIMRPDRGDLEQAHVMWAGPSHEGEDARKLKHVCEFMNREFRQAGLIVDEKRPLKLHCTVLNTVYRKPRSSRRIPFSYAATLASSAFHSIEATEPALANSTGEISGTVMTAESPNGIANLTRGKKPVVVDLGEWIIDQIQICEMGSWGPEGDGQNVVTVIP